MFTNRLFNFIAAAIVMAVVALAVQQAFAGKAIVPDTTSAYIESKEQAVRENPLGERYGQTPNVRFSSGVNECFYVPVSEIACRNQSQAPRAKYDNTSLENTSTFPDYFQRHPELSAPVGRSIDTTDYFFRHLNRNTSSLTGSFTAEQIRREYFLGERYGVTPQGYAQQQALREYWLGERYGQTP